MKKRLIVLSALLFASLSFMAFQCASPEIEGANLYIKQKLWDKAEAQLKKEVTTRPESKEGWKLLGDVYKTTEKYELMVEAYDKALKIGPEYAKEISISKKQAWADCYNRGINNYNKAVKLLQTSPDSANTAFGKAIDNFKCSIMIQPDSTDTYKILLQTASAANKTDVVLAMVENQYNKIKTNKLAVVLGEVYYKEGQKLLATYKSSKVTNDSIKAYTLLDQSIKILQEAGAKSPQDKDILLTLASAMIAADRTKEGKATFEKLVNLDPKDKMFRYNFGVVLLDMKKYDEAAEQFSASLSIDPEYQNAVYNLGVTYIQWAVKLKAENEEKNGTDQTYKEKFKLALPQFEKFLKVKPDEPAVWNLLAKVYANLGQNDKAKEAFDNAEKYSK